MDEQIKLIAFYLPQFHQIPENDEWWGEGFTEWTNVRRAYPMFRGHHQPSFPGELGYYDLRSLSVQKRQIELAQEYGIFGFCYYYYWFQGRRILEYPLDSVMMNPELNLPFCLSWANENWTRRWDGLDQEILIEQKYSPEDDVEFAKSVAEYFSDSRYIRVHGKPLLLVYRISLLPDIQATVRRWREVWRECGVGEVYLVMMETCGEPKPPSEAGFDAVSEFPPYPFDGERVPVDDPRPGFGGVVRSYKSLAMRSRRKPVTPYVRFRGVCPAWDNTPRRMLGATVYHGATPELYKDWLSSAILKTREHNDPEERLIFINAWNEWGEGAHLEPCKRHGRKYLEATREALTVLEDEAITLEDELHDAPVAFTVRPDQLFGDEIITSIEEFYDTFPDYINSDLRVRIHDAEVPLLEDLSHHLLSRLSGGRAGGALQRVGIQIGEDPIGFEGAVVKFPDGRMPGAAEYKEYWVAAVTDRLKNGNPEREHDLRNAAHRALSAHLSS